MYSNNCDSVSIVQQRKIKPTRRSVSGVYCFRGMASIQYESTLERDLIIREEFSADVLDIIPQPVEIPFKAKNGQSYTYTPDFLIYHRLNDTFYQDYPKPLLIEVKPSSEWRKHWRKWLPKWKAAWRYAKEQGWIFHIMDEHRIRDNAFNNIQFLDRYKRMTFDQEDTQWVLNTCKEMGIVSIDYLLTRHFMGIYKAQGLAHIWHLVATRQLDCDIDRALSNMTEVWVPEYD